MAHPKEQVLTHYGPWSDETRAHPAMKWMEDFSRDILDERQFQNPDVAAGDYYVHDMTLQKPDGTIVEGANEVWKAEAAMYSPFAAHKHVPEFLICWKTESGWIMTGIANMYFRLDGPPAAGLVTDPESGEKWHGCSPGSFYFEYIMQGADSIKMKKKCVFSDPSPMLRVMLRNKMPDGKRLTDLVVGSSVKVI